MFWRRKDRSVDSTGGERLPSGDSTTIGGVRLKSGIMLHKDFGNGPQDDRRALAWLSAAPTTPDVWRRVAAEFPTSGLWPVMVDGLDNDGHDLERPWLDGEFDDAQTADGIDPTALLDELWSGVADDADLVDGPWPGLATGTPGPVTPSGGRLVPDRAGGLLLVPSARPADAPAALGWLGATNYRPAADISAVLRSWEDRFGASLAHLGFDTMSLAVARPPTAPDEVAKVAAEHFAFCPDNVRQGVGSLAGYRAGIAGLDTWAFWWD